MVLPFCYIYNTKSNLIGLLLTCFEPGGCFSWICEHNVRRFEITSSYKLFPFCAKCILCNFICLCGSDMPENNSHPTMPYVSKYISNIFHCKPYQHGWLQTLICYAVSMLSSCSIKAQKYNSIKTENTICCVSAPLSFLIVHLSRAICSPHMSFCVFSQWSHSSK